MAGGVGVSVGTIVSVGVGVGLGAGRSVGAPPKEGGKTDGRLGRVVSTITTGGRSSDCLEQLAESSRNGRRTMKISLFMGLFYDNIDTICE